jgi:opacity protein-like surface antigen
VSLHLPTWYNFDKTYRGSMNTGAGGINNSFRDNLSLNSAPKLLVGASGVIAGKAIVSADWELAWYNKIKLARESTDESEARYKPANTFRAGLEYLLTDQISLRAGGVYMMDFMRNSLALDNNPSVKSGYSVTAGVGFSIGSRGYVDVAYVYNRARMTSYDLWLYDDDGQSSGVFTGQFDQVGGDQISRSYTPLRQRHMIALTLGSRF